MVIIFPNCSPNWTPLDGPCRKAKDLHVQQTADGVGKAVSTEIISRLETKLDKILREVSTASGKIDDKHEVELEIAKSQMDDEYDLRKDNLGKIQKEKFQQLEKLIIPLLVKDYTLPTR